MLLFCRISDLSVGSILRIGGSEVSGNSAVTSGGGIPASNGPLTVTNSEINDNSVGSVGGGIAALKTSLPLIGSRLRRNKVVNGSGDALVLRGVRCSLLDLRQHLFLATCFSSTLQGMPAERYTTLVLI